MHVVCSPIDEPLANKDERNNFPSPPQRAVMVHPPFTHAHVQATSLSYMTTQQPHVLLSFSPSIWNPSLGACVGPPEGYDDISLLYLRISRTMS